MPKNSSRARKSRQSRKTTGVATGRVTDTLRRQPNSNDWTCSLVDGLLKERRSADARDQPCRLLLVMSMSGHLAVVS